MSLATTIGAGTLLGGLLAVGVYTAIAPSDAVPASAHVVPTYAPVPTPTVTVEAEDCVAPAVLDDDECVVHKPGPTVTLPAAVAPARTHETTTAPRGDDADEQGGVEQGDDDSQGEDQESEDHESDHQDDGDHEDHDDGGEHEDD